MSFNNKTIEELHDLLVSKEISATELTQATLDDIKVREEAVNAFVQKCSTTTSLSLMRQLLPMQKPKI